MESWNRSPRNRLKTSRRDFLKGSGVIVVSLCAATGAGDLVSSSEAAQAAQAGSYPDPDFMQLDSWIVIHKNNRATFYVGKSDLGNGAGTCYRQMMADELDMAYDKTELIMGDTFLTPDQGGSGGSHGIERDGLVMRRIAAEARRVLLEQAASRFGVTVDKLSVSEGVVTVAADPAKKVTYGELVGDKKFNVTLTAPDPNPKSPASTRVGSGGPGTLTPMSLLLNTTGKAKIKAVQDFKLIGKSIPRYQLPDQVTAKFTYAVDVKLPGMVHARSIKPPVAGATLIGIDEGSVKGLPGFIKVVSKGNFVAVVCEREEQAVRAAEQLKINWQKPSTPPFPTSEGLYDYLRKVTPKSTRTPVNIGDVDKALAGAAKVVEADYEYPFQGHACLAPAHGLADPRNGTMVLYTNAMKPYGVRAGIAELLGMPKDKVRVVWMEGPQTYGRSTAGDAGPEAAYVAKEIGRPVRLMWMRKDELAWDTKGPAYVWKMRGGLDAQGNLVAFDYDARSADYNHEAYGEEINSILMAQFMGLRRKTPVPGSCAGPMDHYVIPNRCNKTNVVGLSMTYESPLRPANLRLPNGPQTGFAGESFIDEMAAAAKADPAQFRLKLLPADAPDDEAFNRTRSIACIRAAVEAYGWDARPSPKPRPTGTTATGRGIACTVRGRTVHAVIADVEVNLQTGYVHVKRFVCAHDCGLVVNPEGLRNCIEGNLLHAMSRTFSEEVIFDTEKVTSVDWISYPITTHMDAPDKIDIVLVNGDPNPKRADLPAYGAGENVHSVPGAAIANAIFDATGVRLRRVPLTPKRVLAALKGNPA